MVQSAMLTTFDNKTQCFQAFKEKTLFHMSKGRIFVFSKIILDFSIRFCHYFSVGVSKARALFI